MKKTLTQISTLSLEDPAARLLRISGPFKWNFVPMPRCFLFSLQRWNPVIAAAVHPCALRIYGFRRRNQLPIVRAIANDVSKDLISRLSAAIFHQSRVENGIPYRFKGCFSCLCFDFAMEE